MGERERAREERERSSESIGYRQGSEAFTVNEEWWNRRYPSLQESKRIWEEKFRNWDWGKVKN